MPSARASHDGADQETRHRLAAVLGTTRLGGWVPDQQAVRLVELAEPGRVGDGDDARSALATVPVSRDRVLDRPSAWWRSPREMSASQWVTAGFVLVALVLASLYVLYGHAAGTPAAPTDTSLSDSSVSASSSNHSRSRAAAAASTSTAGQPAGTSIVVDVSGRVRHPGLVTLPAGSRVAAALKAAGGATHQRDIVAMDLAAKVADGQLVIVGPVGTADGPSGTGAEASGAAASGPIDLNSADLTALETLPGVGPVTAQKIIDWRTAHGGFSSVAQLQQVPGIGPTRFAQLSPLVVS